MPSITEGVFAAILAFLITIGVAFLNCIIGAIIGYLMGLTPINGMVLSITQEIFPNATLVDWGVFLGFLSSLLTLGASGGYKSSKATSEETAKKE